MPRHTFIATAAALALVTGACSTPAAAPASVATVTVSSSPSATVSASAAPADTWKDTAAFVEAVLEDDFEGARAYVAPKSTAARYLDYHENFIKAHKVNGVELPVAPSTVAEPDEAKRAIALVEGSKTVSTWTKFEYDDDGKIRSWVGRKPLTQTIATKVTRGKGLGQTLTLLGASAQRDGNLYVVVEISAGRDASVDSAPSYVAKDGLRRTAAGWVAPPEVEAGTKAIALYIFEDTTLGGTMTYETWAGDQEGKVKIAIG